MKYITFPSGLLDNVPEEVLKELHLSPRKSTDGTKVIMKLIHYEKLFPQPATLELAGEEQPEKTYPYPVYEREEVDALLSTREWTTDDIL